MSSAHAVQLHPIPTAWLQDIVAGRRPASPELGIAEDALPPAHVARRALAQLARGDAPQWCLPFNIVAVDEGRVVGGCGFKGAPSKRTAEIGYGIAPSCWRRGFARSGVSRLLRLGAESGEIDQVIAHIATDNEASSALARGLGFVASSGLVEIEGERLVLWRLRLQDGQHNS
ncbi:MAG: GNAT family N-acetyltransferase [Lysobacterales bacterium]